MLFKEDEVARAEALSVRENVGWYFWTHDLVEVTGQDAQAFLERLLVNRVANLEIGRGRYTTMLDENGTIIDDLVVTRRAADVFWLSTLYGPHACRWFDAHAREGEDVAWQDITAGHYMYAVQGPASSAAMERLLGQSVEGLKRFEMIDATIGDVAVVVDRGGFTGELGYEIYCARKDNDAVREAIEAAVGAPRLSVLEVYVRSLPMEKGMALRQDYFGLTPFEAGLGWSVHFDKDFIGKEALLAAQAEPLRRKFVGFELERESYEDIAQGEIVRKRGIPVGIARAFIYGYTVEKNIGFGIVDAERCPVGTRVKMGPNDSPAIVVEPKWL